MPELPEVETVRLGLEPYLSGQCVKRAQINRYDLRGGIPKDTASLLNGRRVLSTERRGKYMFWHLDNHRSVIYHLGMSGRVRIYDSISAYKEEPHDHVILDFKAGHRVVVNDPRRFGMFYTVLTENIDKQGPFLKMGPEPLGNGFHDSYLADTLKNKKTPIKTALLDQRVVSGLGNIYVCEALFAIGVHPTRLCCDLNIEEISRLVEAVRDVLTKAIAAGGSTLRDYKKADGGMGYFQHHFHVYGREGDDCDVQGCDGKIMRMVQSGRSTFYCPKCQV